MADLSFMRKVIILLIVIFMNIGLFELRVFDFISAPIENWTIKIGDWNKVPEFIKRRNLYNESHKFNDDKIATIVIDAIQKKMDDNWRKEWRKKYAELVRKLVEVGARVIVFDTRFERKMGDEFDKPLIEAIQQAKKHGTSVVIAFGRIKDGKPLIYDDIKREVGDGYGFAHSISRFDEIFKAPLAIQGSKFYSLSLKAVEAYLGGKINDFPDFERRQIEIQHNNNICQKRICHFFDSQIALWINEENKAIQFGDTIGNIFIDTTPIDKFKKYIYYYKKLKEDDDKERLFYKNNNDNYKELSNAEKLDKFNSRIVVIGVETVTDLHKTPLGERYGVLIIADQINTILNDLDNNIMIRALPRWADYILMCLFGFFGIFSSSHIIKEWQIPINFKHLILNVIFLIIALFCCGFLFSIFLYAREGILSNWVYYVITFFSAFGIEVFILKRRNHEKAL